MEKQANKELEQIREKVVRMATLAEEAVGNAITSFMSLNAEAAHGVVGRDGEINELEMAIDKSVFEFLALKAPVAVDLRFLFSVQKMNKDLERIGDHAVNIAQAAIICTGLGVPVSVPNIKAMGAVTRQMLNDAITCFVNADAQLALKVLEHDDQVDDLNRAMVREVIDMVKRDITTIEASLELLAVSKNLERVADLSTNIAEEVIFHAQARDVKHHHSDVDPTVAQK
jgi:phosphate transport system protein